VQEADAIGNQAKRRQDARGLLDLGVAKAPQTVCRDGERRTLETGTALAEPYELQGILGDAERAQFLEERESLDCLPSSSFQR
jgi:hypothetical protein